ncbi:hypothetical protein C8Q76DRAFT_827321 [Earliella scabrosa]|nr:hypothetical protein C8Q76DRAFT_827321 [Earliella scabrosa]
MQKHGPLWVHHHRGSRHRWASTDRGGWGVIGRAIRGCSRRIMACEVRPRIVIDPRSSLLNKTVIKIRRQLTRSWKRYLPFSDMCSWRTRVARMEGRNGRALRHQREVQYPRVETPTVLLLGVSPATVLNLCLRWPSALHPFRPATQRSQSQACKAKSPKCFRDCRDCENSPSARAPTSPTSIRAYPHRAVGSSRLTNSTRAAPTRPWAAPARYGRLHRCAGLEPSLARA